MLPEPALKRAVRLFLIDMRPNGITAETPLALFLAVAAT